MIETLYNARNEYDVERRMTGKEEYGATIAAPLASKAGVLRANIKEGRRQSHCRGCPSFTARFGNDNRLAQRAHNGETRACIRFFITFDTAGQQSGE